MTISRTARLIGLLVSVSLVPAMTAPAWAGSRAAKSRPQAAPTPQVEPVKIDYRQFTLPNGLTAIVYSDRSAPSVFVGVRYRTGSKDEPAGRSGFAHLFEHLMFQSTGNRKGGYLQALEAVGASGINGQTTTDWTDYRQTVPTGALDFALWMESDRMSYLADGITREELEEQRGVVKNEKRQGDGQPGAALSERFLTGYYPPGHPYAHSVIGSMADLDSASLEDVKRWFTDYYGASNAVLVVAGDVDFETARAKITHYFGAVRPGKAIDRIEQWLPALSDIRRETVFDQVGAATITRTWPVSNQDPRERTLLQLAARTMAGSAASPLARALVDEAKVALGVNAQLEERQLGSSFTLSMAVRPGVRPETAATALDVALGRFLAAGPDADRLGAVIASSDMSLLRLMESAPAVGGWMVANMVDHGDPTYFLRQREWIGSATADEVRAVAAKWLERPYYELSLLPTPRLGAAAVDADRSRPPAIAADAAAVRFPPVRETRLANGLTVVVAERPRLPIVEAQLKFSTGSSVDARYAPGAARQALTMMGEGTQTLDRAALVARLAAIGSGLSVDVGARDAALSWRATTPHLGTAFALAADAVRNPRYPQASVERLREAITHQADALASNPGAAADSLFARALWGGDHPRGRIVTPAEARTLDRAVITRFHDSELGPDNATLYLVGDITLDQARTLAERHFGSWQPVHPTPAPSPPPATMAGPRIILVDAPGADQASITVGHLVGPYVPGDAAAEQIVDSALGGSFDSRINGNLRERRGWSYGVNAGIGDDVVGQRAFAVRGNVQVDKTAASMAEIRSELRDFVTARPITAAELDRARISSTRAIATAFASNAAILGALASADVHGRPRDGVQDMIDRLNAVTLDQARAIAGRTYRADALTWVVVGDLARIESEIRALGIAPVEVWDVTGKRLR